MVRIADVVSVGIRVSGGGEVAGDRSDEVWGGELEAISREVEEVIGNGEVAGDGRAVSGEDGVLD